MKKTTTNTTFDWPDPKHNHICPYDLRAFLNRIHKYSLASPQAIVAALVYIDLLVTKINAKGESSLQIAPTNVHILALMGIAIASKFNDDKFVSNKRYAEIGGQELTGLNDMEAAFLCGTGYELIMSPETYKDYEKQIMGTDAGWTFKAESFTAQMGSSRKSFDGTQPCEQRPR